MYYHWYSFVTSGNSTSPVVVLTVFLLLLLYTLSLTTTILGYERLCQQTLAAYNYTVTVIEDLEEAMKLISVCISSFRFSSALRFQQFIRSISTDGSFTGSGALYRVQSTLSSTHESHFDLVYVSTSGYICSTCNEYFEYGFYDRHVIAVFHHGFIDLHPLHQCNSFWISEFHQHEVSVSIETNSKLRAVQKQNYTYDIHLSQFDMAITMTQSAYEDIKNPLETVTTEKAMTYVSKQDVEDLKNDSIVKQCLIELKKLRIHKYDELVQQLQQLTSDAKKVCSKKTIIVTTEENEKISVPKYDSFKQETVRQKITDKRKRTVSDLVDFTQRDDEQMTIGSVFHKAVSSLVSYMSPNKKLKSTS